MEDLCGKYWRENPEQKPEDASEAIDRMWLFAFYQLCEEKEWVE